MDIPTSLEEFKLWKVDRLKEFLKKQKLKMNGRKEELVALAYAAVQMNIAEVNKADARNEKADDYASVLQVEGKTMPDPLSDLPLAWEGEIEMKKWPPCMYIDIAHYFTSIDNIELKQRLMTDYKDGKVFSYLESGWLREIFYNAISAESRLCFLKAECTPLQRINNIPWNNPWKSPHPLLFFIMFFSK
ncbi:hypothetical protein BSL78_30263 [Apostichopus japonicus]|uniref:SAP domain-containing protein n=1 Tax=Stichopus japonicus TaxID=307972 RepID=A0A2G8JB08_STIJA|nr:hypothetical protein BSL78_30263 [Apostichopus japonicus]